MELKDLENIEVSPKDLCVFLDFENPNYLSNLVKNHNFVRSAHGKYPVIANVKRKIEYMKELHQDEIKKIREGNSRSRLESAQAELKELELKEKQGELGSVVEFERAMKNEIAIFIKYIIAFGTQLKYDLNLSPEQYEIIQNKIDGILNQYASLPADTNPETFIPNC